MEEAKEPLRNTWVGVDGSVPQQNLLKDIDLAEKALAEANCKELYRLFEKAVRERGEALNMIGVISKHYLGDKDHPLYQPPNSAIDSMEKVSLAAIQLSRDVALRDAK